MSWFSDFISNGYDGFLRTSASGARSFGLNDLASFIQSEADKSDLRGSQFESALSGVPIVGDLLRGVNGVQQLEDLYSRTGKTSAYPAQQSMGIGSAAHALSEGLSRKIEDGSKDLAVYYSGDRDINNVFDRINSTQFRSSVPGNTSRRGETGWIPLNV